MLPQPASSPSPSPFLLRPSPRTHLPAGAMCPAVTASRSCLPNVPVANDSGPAPASPALQFSTREQGRLAGAEKPLQKGILTVTPSHTLPHIQTHYCLLIHAHSPKAQALAKRHWRARTSESVHAESRPYACLGVSRVVISMHRHDGDLFTSHLPSLSRIRVLHNTQLCGTSTLSHPAQPTSGSFSLSFLLQARLEGPRS